MGESYEDKTTTGKKRTAIKISSARSDIADYNWRRDKPKTVYPYPILFKKKSVQVGTGSKPPEQLIVIDPPPTQSKSEHQLGLPTLETVPPFIGQFGQKNEMSSSEKDLRDSQRAAEKESIKKEQLKDTSLTSVFHAELSSNNPVHLDKKVIYLSDAKNRAGFASVKKEKCRHVYHASLTDFYIRTAKMLAGDTEFTDDKLMDVAFWEIANLELTSQSFQQYINPRCNINHFAHKITGLTLKFLQKYPPIYDVIDDICNYIQETPLIFHWSIEDLKLLDKARKESLEKKNSILGTKEKFIKLKDQRVILDTLHVFNALGEQYDGKKSLLELCRHFGVAVHGIRPHSALGDAKLTGELLCIMMRGKEDVSHKIDWGKLVIPSLDERFIECCYDESVSACLAMIFGKKISMPKGIYWEKRMHNWHLNLNMPALIFPFYTSEDNEHSGVYVHFFLNPQEYKNQILSKPNRTMHHFYGEPESATCTLFKTGDVGRYFSSPLLMLLFYNHLTHEQNKTFTLMFEEISKYFSLEAYVDLDHLKSISFSEDTQFIHLFLDRKIDRHDDEVLKELARSFCCKRYKPLSRFTERIFTWMISDKNIDKWIVRFQKSEQKIKHAEKRGPFIFLNLIDAFGSSLDVFWDNEKQEMKINGQTQDKKESESLIISPPIPEIRISLLGDCFLPVQSGQDPVLGAQEYLNNLIFNPIRIKSPREVEIVFQLENTNRLHKNGIPLTQNSPGMIYLIQKGITTIPTNIHYHEIAFHPILKTKDYACLTVPFEQQNTHSFHHINDKICGYNVIFFQKDGTPLPKKMQGNTGKVFRDIRRITRAKTDEAAYYTPNIDMTPYNTKRAKAGKIVIVSESIEKSLLVRDALCQAIKHCPDKMLDLNNKIGGCAALSVRGVIGINGMGDLPIEEDIIGIIMVADYDDKENHGLKRSIRENCTRYLCKEKIKTWIVLPRFHNRKTGDITDIYNINKSYMDVVDTLLTLCPISHPSHVGEDHTPLEEALIQNGSLLPASSSPDVEYSIVVESNKDTILKYCRDRALPNMGKEQVSNKTNSECTDKLVKTDLSRMPFLGRSTNKKESVRQMNKLAMDIDFFIDQHKKR